MSTTNRYEELYDFAPVGYLTVDRQGIVLEANLTLIGMLGAELGSLLKAPFHRFVSEDDQDIYSLHLQRIRERGSQQTCGLKLRSAGGIPFYAELISLPIFGEQRELKEIRSIVSDATERKKELDLLKASEERHRLFVERAQEGILVAQSGMLRFVNQKAMEIIGWNKANLLSRPFSEFLHPGDKEMVLHHHQLRMQGSLLNTRYPFRIVKKDGEVRWVEIDSSVIPWGNGTAALIFMIDITERMNIDEALRTGEAKLRNILATSPIGIMGLSKDRIVQWLNDACLELLGFETIEEIIGRNAKEFYLTSEEYNKVGDELYEGLEAGEIRTLDTSLKRKDGSTFIGNIRLKAVEGEDLIIAAFSDISERKQAEKFLKDSEARVRLKLDAILLPEKDIGTLELADVIDTATIQNLMSDFFSLTKIGVRIVDLNRNVLVSTCTHDACDVFHCMPHETCPDWEESGTPDSQEGEPGTFKLYRCKNHMWDLVTPIAVGGTRLGNLILGRFFFEDEEFGEIVPCRFHQYGHDEQRFLESLGTIPRLSKETVHMAVTFYLKLMNLLSTLSYSNIKLAKILAERERLATAIEQVEESVVVTNADGAILYVNPAFEKTTGYSFKEVTGGNPRVLKSSAHDDGFYISMWKTISTGGVWRGRLINKKKDGTLYEEEATISPVKDEQGKIVNYVAVKRDVTKEVSLQRQLHQSQKLEAIGTLAGGIAHDFNNLLQVVSGYSEMLLQEKKKSDPDYSDISKILQAARSGAELVRRLLTFSRKVESKPVPSDLNQQILHIEKLVQRTIPKMIDIQLNLVPNLARINADPSQMEQLLMNLVLNARDAMPNGGKLTIATENVTLDEEYCSVHIGAEPGPYVLLSVSDTGHGMDKETLAHIFEPFYTTKELGRGTGLGLAIVHGVVNQHSGHITCYSQEGQGTTFRIFLPAIETEPEMQGESSGTMPAFGTETILIVDDEDLVREFGTRILSRAGYTVIQATDGKQALEIYNRPGHDISLVVLDLMMPVMGGKECLAELLTIDPKVKVLITSGYSADGLTKGYIENGAQEFVSKPFKVKELLRKIRMVLDRN